MISISCALSSLKTVSFKVLSPSSFSTFLKCSIPFPDPQHLPIPLTETILSLPVTSILCRTSTISNMSGFCISKSKKSAECKSQQEIHNGPSNNRDSFPYHVGKARIVISFYLHKFDYHQLAGLWKRCFFCFQLGDLAPSH